MKEFCSLCGRAEHWRINPENDAYEISTIGRIRRAKPAPHTHVGRIVKQHPMGQRGDWHVGLYDSSGKLQNRYVAILVALTFIGPKPNSEIEVNHKDLNYLHNCDWNLEYLSGLQNIHHAIENGVNFGSTPKLSCRKAQRIIKEYREEGSTQRELGKKYGVHCSVINRVIKGKTWNRNWLEKET
jgi:hypothetical protein